MVVCDIGANIGYFTTLMSSIVGPTGRVIAFEPDKYNFSVLEKNVEQNQLPNVILSNCALGRTTEIRPLYKSSSNFGDHRLFRVAKENRSSEQVSVHTLDNQLKNLGFDHADLIKLDVQGYEYHVQCGMEDVLAGAKLCTVLTEFWPFGIQSAGGCPKAFFRTFLNFGFIPNLLNRDGSITATDEAAVRDRLSALESSDSDSCYLNLVFERKAM